MSLNKHVMDLTTRARLDELLRKRFFYAPSFSIYGSVAGLYDYGPPGTALQTNIVSLWRNHFVLEESMLELDASILTLHPVLKASGHVDRFTDYLVRDTVTGDSFRADHLLEAALERRLEPDYKPVAGEAMATKEELEFILAQIDGYSEVELQALLDRFKVVSPETGNTLSPLVRFNLMFPADIGPTGNAKGYMRPETAQGMFVNFKRLLDCNMERMPFAAAQVGKSFRNEISPRAGLLRVREFLMAEIEHFVDPLKKDHPRFQEVAHIQLPLLSAPVQQSGSSQVTEMTVGEAVAKGIIDNETLGYFLARTKLFMLQLGLRLENIRFRQHLDNEMSHYASDCWDCELKSSYGWIECVGCADRSAYDLTQHSGATGEKLVVRERLPEPLTQTTRRVVASKKDIGKTFKADAASILARLENMQLCEAEPLFAKRTEEGLVRLPVTQGNEDKIFELTPEMASIQDVTETVHVREYIPNVIEPSFGIGRILYSLLENVFWTRDGDEQRAVLSLPSIIAPVKILVAPLSAGKPEFDSICRDLVLSLRRQGLTTTVDDASTSIGRRYARHDEIGVPFATTIDFQSVQDSTVTLRERDSTEQVRMPMADLPALAKALVFGEMQWSEVVSKYGLFTA